MITASLIFNSFYLFIKPSIHSPSLCCANHLQITIYRIFPHPTCGAHLQNSLSLCHFSKKPAFDKHVGFMYFKSAIYKMAQEELENVFEQEKKRESQCLALTKHSPSLTHLYGYTIFQLFCRIDSGVRNVPH